jgi:membrane protein required for colicin V production
MPPTAASPMSPFDVVVYAVALVAVVLGFNAGLLRSLATILGYLAAAPITIAVTPRLMALASGQYTTSPERIWLALGGVFLAVGFVVSALLRHAVGSFSGPDVGIVDRLAGAVLGAVRIGLIAVLIVVIFDRIIPANRQPTFLVDSKLRPYLSAAGQMGLKSLPPDVEATIDRLKRQRGI